MIIVKPKIRNKINSFIDSLCVLGFIILIPFVYISRAIAVLLKKIRDVF